MEISFESNIREWAESMNEFQREQVPFATALALTRTAEDAREEHRRLLPIVFDRPTRYTMNALRVTTANKYTLKASVFFKDPPGRGRHYLMPQVEGGSRPHKRFEYWLIKRGIMLSSEFAVPAKGIALNSYGNVSPGVVVQILSQLAAGPDATQWETLRSRKRAGSARARYFVPKPNSRLPRGIWRVNGKRLEAVFIFVSRVDYKVRYEFFDITHRHTSLRFPINFAEAFERALATGFGR